MDSVDEHQHHEIVAFKMEQLDFVQVKNPWH